MIARADLTEENSPVICVAEARLPTALGEFKCMAFRDLTTGEESLTLSMGEFRKDQPVLVRIHSQCLTGDVLGSERCDCGPQLNLAMKRIAAIGRGLMIYQFQEGRGIGILNKIRAYELQDLGADTVDANSALGLPVDARNYDMCANVLHYLRITSVRLMTNNPAKVDAMLEAGIAEVRRESLVVEPSEHCAKYLKTKVERMGHILKEAAEGPTAWP